MPFGIAPQQHVRFFRGATDILKSASPTVTKPLVDQALNVATAGRSDNIKDPQSIKLAQAAVQLCLDVVEKEGGGWPQVSEELDLEIKSLAKNLSSILQLVDKKLQKKGGLTVGSQEFQDAIAEQHKNLENHKLNIRALIPSDSPSNRSSPASLKSFSSYRKSSSRGSGSTTYKSSFQHIPPPPPAIFFGRSQPLDAVVKCILSAPEGRPANVAILGTGGVGKSTLALSILHDARIETYFAQNRYFVRCDTARSAEDLLAAIAKELGITGPKAMEHVPKILAEMTPGVLLVLDNFETPWELEESRRDVEMTLQRLSSTISTLSLVITMRGQQRPRGTLWTKPLLPPLMPIDLEAARQTFSAISPDLEDDPVLDELLEAVDCLPLAVTLLAAVAEGEPSLDNVLARWHLEKTKFFKDGSGNDRLGSLEASIEVSIQCFRMKSEPSALDLLSLLSLLPNGVAVADTQTSALGLKPSALGAAAALRKVALAYDDVSNSRLRVLSPIRIYTASKYPPSSHSLSSLQSHYANVAHLGKKVGKTDGIEVIPRLISEAENIQAIVEHALTQNNEDRQMSWDTIRWAFEAATDLTEFLWYSGLGSTRSLEIAASVARSLQQPSGEADCLSSIGFVASGRAEYALAEDSYLAALERYHSQKDIPGEAECLRGLGFVAHHVGDYDKSVPYLHDGLALFGTLGNKWGEGECLKGLAMVSSARLQMDDASEKFALALRLFREVRSATGEADCMRGVGFVALNTGGPENLESAAQSFKKALDLFRQIGKLTGEGDCLQGLGLIELSRGNFELSKGHFENAFEIYSIAGHPWKKALSLRGLGDVAARTGQNDDARAVYEEALNLFKQVGNKKAQAQCISALEQLKEKPRH